MDISYNDKRNVVCRDCLSCEHKFDSKDCRSFQTLVFAFLFAQTEHYNKVERKEHERKLTPRQYLKLLENREVGKRSKS